MLTIKTICTSKHQHGFVKSCFQNGCTCYNTASLDGEHNWTIPRAVTFLVTDTRAHVTSPTENRRHLTAQWVGSHFRRSTGAASTRWPACPTCSRRPGPTAEVATIVPSPPRSYLQCTSVCFMYAIFGVVLFYLLNVAFVLRHKTYK